MQQDAERGQQAWNITEGTEQFTASVPDVILTASLSEHAHNTASRQTLYHGQNCLSQHSGTPTFFTGKKIKSDFHDGIQRLQNMRVMELPTRLH